MDRVTKIEHWDWGVRDTFRLWYDPIYYDGNHYCLNLGWFYISYHPTGL